MTSENSEKISCRLWFAVQTRSRHEKVVRDRLTLDGFEQLLPIIRRLSQWTDRKKWIEVPLFSGYCFARFSLEERSTVLRAPGVVKIVGTTASPEPITEEEIEAIKKLSTCSLTYDTHPYLVEGMPVEVVKGPLVGVKGQLIRKAGQSHIVIRIHLIQQAAAVHIDAADLAPIERRARATCSTDLGQRAQGNAQQNRGLGRRRHDIVALPQIFKV